MRHLELHVIETEHDVDLAIQAGLVTAEQLNHSECADCAELVGHASDEFTAFVVVLDELDNDWPVCIECASPLIDSVDNYADFLDSDQYTETFNEDDFETF